jgi:serine/threonine protein kinase/WD40 repeat protein
LFSIVRRQVLQYVLNMPSERTCAGCGALLPAGRPAAFCACCLLTGALTPLPATPAEAAPSVGTAPGLRVGDYELLAPLAQGGMGSVWCARQVVADRLVAYKTVTSGRLASAAERRRFQTEIEAAARLEHPNIVPIYEVGDDEGRPFFTMRLMEGGTLAQRISDRKSGISNSEAARLLAKVARAVHFAHERGILHRDLKPGNILLDAAGEPFVADFGLARRLELDSSLTLSGDVLGTPAYLAPEVAAGGSRDATIASDLYALGAILYELLTGRPPFLAPTVPELLRRITEQDPVAPRVLKRRLAAQQARSSQVAPRDETPDQLAIAPGDTPLRSSDFGLASGFGLRASDLDTICLKSLAKNPAVRYASAAALADDLERWLRGDPIQARAPSLVEFSVRWTRKHRVGAALLSVAAILPAVIIALLVWANAYSRHEREQTRLNLYAADIATAALALERGDFSQAAQALAAHEPRAGERDLRGFEWRWLQRRALGDAQAAFRISSGEVRHLAFSPDGRWLAAAAFDGTVGILDPAGRTLTASFDLARDIPPPVEVSRGWPRVLTLQSLSFSPDSRRLVTTTARGMWAWELPSLKLSATNDLQAFWALFLPGQTNQILASHREPALRRFWGDTANRLTLLDGDLHRLRDFCYVTNFYGSLSADGSTLATYDYRNASVWNTSNATVLQRFSGNGAFHRIALSPDGRRAAICYQMQPLVELWDPHAGQRLGEFKGHTANAVAVAFSPDGRWLATGAGDETIRLWDVTTQRELRVLRGHQLPPPCVAFSPDGRLLASGGNDGSVLLWDVAALAAPAPPVITNLAPPLVFSTDGRSLASGLRSGGMGIWEIASRRLVRAWSDVKAEDLIARFGHDGFLLLGRESASQTDLAVLACSASGEDLSPVGGLRVPATGLSAAALTADGALCFTGNTNGVLSWWEVAGGQLVGQAPAHDQAVAGMQLAPNGRRLITYTYFPREMKSWSVNAGRWLATNHFPGRNLLALALSPDGAECATGGVGTSFRLWDTDRLELRTTSPPQRAEVHLLAYSPDGQTLAEASGDGKLRLWHLPTRRPLLTLSDRPTSQPRLIALAFSPDGQWLAACDTAGELHLWPAPRHDARPPAP